MDWSSQRQYQMKFLQITAVIVAVTVLIYIINKMIKKNNQQESFVPFVTLQNYIEGQEMEDTGEMSDAKKKPLRKIPKTIYITYPHKKIPMYVLSNWKEKNPGYQVELWDKKECESFLQKEYGTEYVNIYQFIKDKQRKSDFMKCSILYKLGGVATDVDVKPLASLSLLIKPDMEFCTAISANNHNTNSCVLMSKPGHSLLKTCLDLYRFKYKAGRYSKDDWELNYLLYLQLLTVLDKKMGKIEGDKDYSKKKITLFQEEFFPGFLNEPSDEYKPYGTIHYDSRKYFQNHYYEFDRETYEFESSDRPLLDS